MQKLEQRAWSATWDVPEEIMQIALQETRQWAVEAFGDLSQPFTDTISFVWERYRWE
jgi:hypothetical protein